MAAATERKEQKGGTSAEPEAEGRDSEQAVASTSPARRWPQFLARNWLVIFLVASLLTNAGVLGYYRTQSRTSPPPPPQEIDLGTFRFEADKAQHGRIAGTTFALHIALQSENDTAARQRLAERKCRVQQDVEELLRRAQSADFEDPKLKELKRQLLEQIDETLGVKAVAEVIITDLKVVTAER